MEIKNHIIIANLNPDFQQTIDWFNSKKDSLGWLLKVLDETPQGLWVEMYIPGISVQVRDSENESFKEIAKEDHIYPVFIPWNYILSMVLISEDPYTLKNHRLGFRKNSE